ncbi:hypothetical protein N7462_011704 [Penicillium macrosclerotiorum]|uniref:uncharacterized protein n=1 Tax=Penicillium macrosclerotiorum TaxID=303699 RepID=UPI00254731BE|nr:uncharacterized protein N7462_011704 [Penicillium macrosclerotiorum]KAJ5662778.1 hypothetical protein N7462_011704 [Penicillium macrosclerotiorum]
MVLLYQSPSQYAAGVYRQRMADIFTKSGECDGRAEGQWGNGKEEGGAIDSSALFLDLDVLEARTRQCGEMAALLLGGGGGGEPTSMAHTGVAAFAAGYDKRPTP